MGVTFREFPGKLRKTQWKWREFDRPFFDSLSKGGLAEYVEIVV